MATTIRLSVRITAYLLVGTVFLLLIEASARVLSPNESDDFARSSMAEVYRRIYLPEEVDKTLPLQFPRQGGNCVDYRLDKDRIYYKFYWNPWWGRWGKSLDSDCAKKLFAAHPIKVMLFGGSAMDNAEAPNYLTRIDYLAFKSDDRIASINLAESGARLSNMVARFVHEAVDLKPDVAVFLDGFNEFNSVRYGGLPGYDYYWTAGVSRRIEKPMSVLVDKLIDISGLARVLLLHTGLIHSARLPQLSGPPSPEKDVRIYLRDRDLLRFLCRDYAIECVFILQPSAFVAGPGDKSAERAVLLHAKFFPYDAQLFRSAYHLLRMRLCDGCVDASNLFDDVEDGYFDVVHFTKSGGEKLGRLIHRQVLSAYERKLGRK